MPTNINVRSKDNKAILDLSGAIDINSSNVIEAVNQLLKTGSLDILCNFEGVEMIDYMGISVVAIAGKSVLNHKGRFVLYNVPAHVVTLFGIVGLGNVLEVSATEETALASVAQDRVIAQIVQQKLRRRFKRLAMRVIFEYKEKFSQQERWYKGRALNLSAVGAFILGEKCFSLGDILEARMLLPPANEPLLVDTRVVWLARKEFQPHLYPGFGVEFYQIDPRKQEQIVEYIEKNMGTLE